ncbi:MAG: enoyl-CoA hydratase-related protein [Dehalococcoidia bacterium]
MPVRYEADGHIVTITIDRPEALNALDLDTWRAFGEATQRFEDDAEAWVGIVTGAGDRAFCAGADIKTTIRRLMDDPRGNPYDEPATIMRGQSPTKPLIAAVNGVALGGGLEVALACDLRIASSRARFGAPEVNLGLIPGWGGTQRLPRQVPYAIAAKLVLTGEMISAAEALQAGLVNAVVEPEQLLEEARRVAGVIASRGPLAVRAAKRAMVEGYSLPLEEGLALEHQLFDGLAYTKDVQEGIAAFEEKRTPDFRAE